MVFLDDPHLYSACPFVISSMCKCKDVNSQQKLLETACTVVCQKLWDVGLQLYSIASDRDSWWQLATANLTLIQEIAPDSELWSWLGDLALFNYLCGAYDMMADINYKHLLKWLHNTLLCLKCITLDGVVLTSQLLKCHLITLGIRDKWGINALLSPKDKQDVKLMFDLLSSIASLPPPSSTNSPSVQQSCKVLQLLSCLYAHLLGAYTNVNLTLHQQLTHLSAAAHLVLTFYTKEKGHNAFSTLFWSYDYHQECLCLHG